MIPWRLILLLVILTVFIVFAGFNIDNTSDISFGFVTISEVPVFLSIPFAFVLGAFLTIGFHLIGYVKYGKQSKINKKREKKEKSQKKKEEDEKQNQDESQNPPSPFD